jgi:type IV secretory pathway ATPase VirB11/archaellum biosynthesis ATPase
LSQRLIFQREVGTKVKDFKTGLVDALRANPTTIVIGEIRDSWLLIFLNLLAHKKASTQCPYRHLKHRLSQRLMYETINRQFSIYFFLKKL